MDTLMRNLASLRPIVNTIDFKVQYQATYDIKYIKCRTGLSQFLVRKYEKKNRSIIRQFHTIVSHWLIYGCSNKGIKLSLTDASGGLSSILGILVCSLLTLLLMGESASSDVILRLNPTSGHSERSSEEMGPVRAKNGCSATAFKLGHELPLLLFNSELSRRILPLWASWPRCGSSAANRSFFDESRLDAKVQSYLPVLFLIELFSSWLILAVRKLR